MALRAADLEVLFTANITGYEAGARKVQATNKALAGSKTETEFIASAVQALKTISDVRAELNDVNKTRTTAEIEADAVEAIKTAGEVVKRLREVDDLDVTAKVDIDASGADKGLRRAEEGMSEFKDEANSTAREGAASFTGEFDDVADVIQETLANALVGFGPAGAAAGLAAAAGIGIVIQKAQQTSEAINEARGDIAGMAADISDAGGRLDAVDFGATFNEWSAELHDVRSAWEVWQDEAVSNLDNVRAAARTAGADISEYVGALATGDVDSAREQLAGFEDQAASLSPVIADLTQRQVEFGQHISGTSGKVAVEGLTEAERERLATLTAQRDALDSLAGPMRDQIDAYVKAKEEGELVAAAVAGITVEQLRLQNAVEDANGALEEQRDLTTAAATSQIGYEQAIDDAAEAIKKTGKAKDLDTQAGRDNADQLLNLSNATTQFARDKEAETGSVRKGNAAIKDGRAEFIKAAQAASYTKREARKLADQYGLIPKKVSTTAEANTESAREKVAALRREADALDGKRINIFAKQYFSTAGTKPAGAGTVLKPDYALAAGGAVQGAADPTNLDDVAVTF